ncbi:hypothetical protein [Piscirickettsia salmonis]|nr:hypothetical protein [Piscirickettsia salmonis]
MLSTPWLAAFVISSYFCSLQRVCKKVIKRLDLLMSLAFMF